MNYGEPWEARQLPALVISHPDGCDQSDDLVGNRPVHIWARLGIPGEAQAFLSPGEIVEFDGLRPIMEIFRLKGLRQGSPDYVQIAERLVACVNFCAGVDFEETGCTSLADLIERNANTENGEMRKALNDYFASSKKGGASRASQPKLKADTTQRRRKRSSC